MDYRPVNEIFEQQCRSNSGATAIVESDQSISYGELNQKADTIAQQLRFCSLENQSVIVTFLPPGIRLVASLLGIFKSGNIYLPLDMGFPRARIRQILSQTKPAAIITTTEMQSMVSQLLEAMDYNDKYLLLLTESLDTQLYIHSDQRCTLSAEPFPVKAVDPNDGNYIIYTSGSTGMGKAILGCHKALSHFIHWELREFGIDAGCRVSQLSRITFDASFRDLFVPLCSGGTLYIPETDIRNNVLKLVDWIESNGITLVHCVPSLFRLILKELSHAGNGYGRMSKLRQIIMAGESLYSREIQEWRKHIGEHIELVNLYGTSETTMAKTCHRIKEVPANGAQPVHAGKAISHAAIAIINAGHICRVGETGEIYIKTPFSTKGYYNNEALTRSLFVQNPLVSDREDIVYKTGDMGRYLADRSIEVLGRLDDQVKINGIRVELDEIGQTVSRIKGMEQVVVLVHKNASDENEMVCYYTGKEQQTAWLREQLKQELNSELIPGYFIRLEEMPLNLNGKIDRKSLPEPGQLLQERDEYEPVQGATEILLENIWKEVLGRERIGRQTVFFKIGGTSLKAMQVISRIFRQFEVSFSIKDIFNYTTIRELADAIRTASTKKLTSIDPVEPRPAYQLSPAQKRLWIQTQLPDRESLFNMVVAIELKGPFDLASLQFAFTKLIERHESLRTQIIMVAGEPMQVVHSADQLGFKIDYVDVKHDPDCESLVGQYAHEEAAYSFRADEVPLIRCKVIQPAHERAIILINMHHIVGDGWSLQIIFSELGYYYNTHTTGKETNLQPLKIQYKDFAAWINAQLGPDQVQVHRNFWRRQFAGDVPVLELPLDFYRGESASFNGYKLHRTISEADAEKISSFIASQQSTAFVYLVSCVNVLLYSYSHQSDFVLGTVVNGRVHIDVEPVVGLFVNLLPIRCRFQPDHSFLELTKTLKETTFACYEHEIYPFDFLVEDLGITGNSNRSPLFDVLVQMQEKQGASGLEVTEESTVDADSFALVTSTSKYDLTFNFFFSAPVAKMIIEYNKDLFRNTTIAQFMNKLEQIISITCRDPSIPVTELCKRIRTLAAAGLVTDNQFINETMSDDF